MTATTQESAAPAQVKQAVSAISVSGIVDLADGHAFVRTSGYRRGPDGVYRANAIEVLTISASRVTHVVAFLDPPLFPAFGLPLALPSQ